MERTLNPGTFITGRTITRPASPFGCSERPNSSAAAMLAYSAACTPAVTTSVGPGRSPLIRKNASGTCCPPATTVSTP